MQANPVCLSACSVTLLNHVTSISSSVLSICLDPNLAIRSLGLSAKMRARPAPIYPSRHRKTAKTGQSAKQRNSGQSRLAQGTSCRGRPTLLHSAALPLNPLLIY